VDGEKSLAGGVSTGKDLHDTRREIVDVATQKLGCQHVAVGDVYELKSSDTSPAESPFFQLRYAVLGGLASRRPRHE
jgi:hypothetical protein